MQTDNMKQILELTESFKIFSSMIFAHLLVTKSFMARYFHEQVDGKRELEEFTDSLVEMSKNRVARGDMQELDFIAIKKYLEDLKSALEGNQMPNFMILEEDSSSIN